MSKVPKYYIGTNGYEASKVVAGFQADSYNIGTAITYLLRAGKKVYKNSPEASKIEDIKKAIHHLEFELERLDVDRAYKSFNQRR